VFLRQLKSGETFDCINPTDSSLCWLKVASCDEAACKKPWPLCSRAKKTLLRVVYGQTWPPNKRQQRILTKMGRLA